MSYTIKAELLTEWMDGSAVILAPQCGQVLVLNRCGSLIWRLLIDDSDMAVITHQLTSHYHITHQQAHTDLHAFLAELANYGLVTEVQTESCR